MEQKYSLECHYEIWNDKTGEHIRIGPDRDGLDLIEIRSMTDDGKIGAVIVLDHEQADKLRIALNQLKPK